VLWWRGDTDQFLWQPFDTATDTWGTAEAIAGTGTTYGVYGRANSANGFGVYAANSNAALRLGAAVAFDAIRPGIFLYGGAAGGERPQPVVSWRARLVEVNRRPAGETVSYGATWSLAQPTVLATVSVGYADGLPRALGNSGAMLLGGRRHAR